MRMYQLTGIYIRFFHNPNHGKLLHWRVQDQHSSLLTGRPLREYSNKILFDGSVSSLAPPTGATCSLDTFGKQQRRNPGTGQGFDYLGAVFSIGVVVLQQREYI